MSNLPPGLSLSGDTISGTPTIGGELDIIVAATNAAGTSSTLLHLVIARPAGTNNTAPTMSSPPSAASASGTTGQAVTFSTAASDAEGDILYYLWNFGDGTTAAGDSVSHVYSTPGIYTVTVTISDGTTSTVGTMDFLVSAAQEEGEGGGDNVWAAGTQNTFTVQKASAKFTFPSSAKDGLQLSGTVPVVKFFVPLGKTVEVVIGGVSKTFSLNARGQGVSGSCKFQLKGKMKQGVFKATPAKFTLTVKGEPLLASLEEFGFANTTTDKAGAPVNIFVMMLVSQMGYEADATLLYKAKQGKSGKAAKAK